MGAIKVTAFGGMVPAIDDRLLPDQAAAYAENTYLNTGALVGLPDTSEVHECTLVGTGSVFRVPLDYAGATSLDNSVWMEFEHPYTTVVRAPVIDDTYDRYYWAAPNTVPKYNTKDRIVNGDGEWILGVPTPGSISVSASGGSLSADTRSYVVTWVSAYGEEGAPSPPETVTGKVDDTWTITLPAEDPDDLGTDRNLTHARIYRTVGSTYFLVAEVDITDPTYDDTDTDATVSSNSQLQSTTWTPPPTDLQGLIFMANGMLVGWRENELWFSEPYRPHAWPVAYVQVVEFPIIGLGVVNQTLVVCTQGFPMTASGINPASITMSKLTSLEPCTSRGSIISAPEGVYYTSPNGLVRVNPGRAENVTRELLTKDKWQTLTKTTSLRAARFGTSYFAFGTVQLGVFDEDAFDVDGGVFEAEDYTPAYLGVLIDPTNDRIAFSLLSSEDPTVNVQNDPWSGEVLIIRGDVVYWIDQTTAEPVLRPYIWRSKVYQTSSKKNLGAMKVFFEVPPNTPALNPVRNTDQDQTLAEDQYGIVRVYADGRRVAVWELRESGELWQLPSGFKADYWQFEVEARVRVLSVQLATSPKELRSV